MPVIKLDVLKMDREKKAQMAKELTATAARYTGLPEQSFFVFISEYDPENVAVGGTLLPDRQK